MNKKKTLPPKVETLGKKMIKVLKKIYGIDAFIDYYRSNNYLVTIGVDNHRYMSPLITQDRAYYIVNKKGQKELHTCYIKNMVDFVNIVNGDAVPFKDLGTTKPV